MKMAMLVMMAWSIISPLSRAETICLWDFNSSPPDDSTRTGTLSPAAGVGTAELVGETSGTFASGSSSDPSPDNSGWNTASYPPQGSGNKGAGVQFNVSTAGYRDITVRFEQRVTSTASRYARLQYTFNGIDFVDGPVIELSAPNSFVPQIHSLAAISQANDNPNFAIRIVAEFESSATGQGPDEYVTASSSSYSSSGTVRFDWVDITGEPIGSGNTPPTIAAIPDQFTLENVPTPKIPLTVGDAETPPAELGLEASSSNSQLVPPANIALAGDGGARTIAITPAPGQSGLVVITVTVSDGTLTATASFLLTIVARVDLEIAAEEEAILLSWPVKAEGYQLQSSESLSPPVWELVTDVPAVQGDRLTLGLEKGNRTRFFRLLNPNIPSPDIPGSGR